jgi:hypothetical protein
MIAIDFFKQDGRCSALSLRRKKNIVHTERSLYTRSAGADRKRKKTQTKLNRTHTPLQSLETPLASQAARTRRKKCDAIAAQKMLFLAIQ